MKKIFIILFLTSISITAQQKKSIKFELLNFSNNKSNDFAPSLFKDGILFVSDRNSSFYNLYFYNFKSSPKKIKISNQKYHIGQAFYDNKNEIIYVTKSSNEKSKTNRINLAVFQGTLRKYKIKKLKKLNFCNPDFSYGYAQILENKLLISTDEKGIFSLNIYNKKKNKWNFQKTIFKDKSPILNPVFKNKTTIIFASKRDGGNGGIDLYETKENNGKWSNPINLKEFNSEFDDLSILYLNENEGYISSNRVDNKDHIFKFEIQ